MRRLATLLAALLLATGDAAQDYPGRPVQILVGYGPGGGTDIMARVLAGPLSRQLRQPVVVRNLPGAGGQIAATALPSGAATGMRSWRSTIPTC